MNPITYLCTTCGTYYDLQEDLKEDEHLPEEGYCSDNKPDVCGIMHVEVNDRRRLYINVYETDQGYGGPEEGGWWYDTGEPVASVPTEGIASYMDDPQHVRLRFSVPELDRERIMLELAKTIDFGATRRPNRTKIYVTREEPFMARPFPRHAPRYE